MHLGKKGQIRTHSLERHGLGLRELSPEQGAEGRLLGSEVTEQGTSAWCGAYLPLEGHHLI